MSNNLSAADRTYLSAQQQAQIQALKQANLYEEGAQYIFVYLYST